MVEVFDGGTHVLEGRLPSSHLSHAHLPDQIQTRQDVGDVVKSSDLRCEEKTPSQNKFVDICPDVRESSSVLLCFGG